MRKFNKGMINLWCKVSSKRDPWLISQKVWIQIRSRYYFRLRLRLANIFGSGWIRLRLHNTDRGDTSSFPFIPTIYTWIFVDSVAGPGHFERIRIRLWNCLGSGPYCMKFKSSGCILPAQHWCWCWIAGVNIFVLSEAVLARNSKKFSYGVTVQRFGVGPFWGLERFLTGTL